MAESRLRYLFNLVERECTVGEPPHASRRGGIPVLYRLRYYKNSLSSTLKSRSSWARTRTHLEMYTITKPTVIRVPAGMWHGPVQFKRIGAPINFMPFYPSGEYGKVVREVKAGRYDGPIYTGAPTCRK